MMKTLTRRDILKGLGAAAAAAMPWRARAAEAKPPSKPNIVLLLIDDMGWSDLSCQGSTFYDTPNIDKLCARGMKFTNAYANAANCAPTRACMMSGKYSPRHGVYTVGDPWRGGRKSRKLRPVANNTTLSPKEITIAESLQRAGYVSASMGKWHLGAPGTAGPNEQGFDLNVGGTHAGSPPGGYFLPNRLKFKNVKKGEYLTDRLTDEAVKFIEANKAKHFFLYLPHYAVHTPIQAKKEMIGKYRNRPAWHGQKNATYAAMVESVDQSVGRIVAKLDELKITDNTIIFFMSDNGGVGGYETTGLTHKGITDNWPLKGGKGQFYEGGIREPMFVVWPGKVKPGSTCDVPVIGTDFYPTILEMAGVKPKPGQVLDGESLVPLLRQTGGLKREAIFWHFPCYLQAGGRGVRTSPVSVVRKGDFKLMWFFEGDRLELYDLGKDIGEKTDLAKKMPEKTKELHQTLKAWMKSVHAPIPPPNPDYDPNFKGPVRKKRRRTK